MINTSKLRLALIRWNDAYGSGEDAVTLESVRLTHQPTVVTTIGWILLEDKEGISIVNEVYGDTFRGRTFIPAAMVLSVEDYSLSKKRVSRTAVLEHKAVVSPEPT